MKKAIVLLLNLTLIIFLASCSLICQHRDADDDSLCDECGEAYTDGTDITPPPACQHRDADDDSLCDECGEAYTDGTDITPPLACQHRDADDDSLCDECGEAYTDGTDITPPPVCQHRDADDDSLCDECGEVYTDGTDITPPPACQHRDADDDSLCDECGEAYTDEADIPTPPECQHIDFNDDFSCDECGEPFSDGIDVQICRHKDTDGDSYCDRCGEKYAELEDEPAECLHNDEDADRLCDGCGEPYEAPQYTRDGGYVYFGEYPQTLKSDSVTVTDIRDSRGYYLGSDGFYYLKLIASPCAINYKFSDGTDVKHGEIYYFKVEPIRWRILESDDESALIICDSIIEIGAFDEFNRGDCSNNYAESDVRAWLNETFLESAFDELMQDIILVSSVDNSAIGTGDSENQYATVDTNDKIFLVSYSEVINDEYGFYTLPTLCNEARSMKTSDYARARGAWITTELSYYGNGYWWLRSPYRYYDDCVRYVNYDGVVGNDADVTIADAGIVPTLRIRL